MNTNGEIKDILVLGFMREGLNRRNRDLEEAQKLVAMALLARRNDTKALKQAYRIFVILEKAITNDYKTPLIRYTSSLHQGKKFLEKNAPDVEYGKKYPRTSRRVFNYLKSRFPNYKQRY